MVRFRSLLAKTEREGVATSILFVGNQIRSLLESAFRSIFYLERILIALKFALDSDLSFYYSASLKQLKF